jgi:hypothetical protein
VQVLQWGRPLGRISPLNVAHQGYASVAYTYPFVFIKRLKAFMAVVKTLILLRGISRHYVATHSFRNQSGGLGAINYMVNGNKSAQKNLKSSFT